MSVSNFPSFETGDYFEWMIKQSLLNSAFALSEELWRSWSVLYMYAKNKKKTKASVYILKPSVSVTLLDLHNSSDDTQTLNIYHRHTHVHLLPIIVWSVQVIYTVEPLLTDTSLIRTVHLVPGKCPYILCKNNLYNTDPL